MHERRTALNQGSTSLLNRATVMSLVAAIAFGTMMPRLLSAEFGLLDDGVTVQFSRALGAALGEGDLGFLFRFEVSRGRFRPLYWLYGALQYSVWGPNPLGFFLTNGLALALTALFVSGTVAFATKDALASLIAGVAYVLCPPVAESYYTLSKPEVPLALWLAVSLCCWAGARVESEHDPTRSRRLFSVSAVALLLAYFTKETAQVLLLVSLAWVIARFILPRLAWSPGAVRVDRWYLGANLLCTALLWIARYLSGTAGIAAGDDSRHYALTAEAMLSNGLGHLAWYFRDFPLLAPLLAFRWWRGKDGSPSDPWPVLLPVGWVMAWTLIMLPWHSILEYYLLPASLGVSIITGIGMASVWRSLRAPPRPVRIAARILLALGVLSLPLTLGNAITSSRLQVAVDAANARLVKFLAANAPPASTVFVNIPEPNEYVYELGVHLALFNGRPDVKVMHSGDRGVRRDEEVLVVTPVMTNQSFPSVRLAVYETGVQSWRNDVYVRLGQRARLVYRGTEQVRLLGVQLQAPMCPMLAMASAHYEFLCSSRQPLLDLRRFEYGWEVYRGPWGLKP